MNKIVSHTSPSLPQRRSIGQRLGFALLSIGVLALGNGLPNLPAIAAPDQVISQQQGWNGVLRLARLVGGDNALVMQLDLLDKPQTRYANAVYQVFARKNGQWTQIFTSTGARLITANGGRVLLEPEVIRWSDLQRQLGSDVDLAQVELRALAQIRYDIPGYRDQTVQFEQIQTYQALAQTTTPQLGQRWNDPSAPGINQGNFSLAIVQKQVTLPGVIARLSVKEKQGKKFKKEKFIGDFRYRINQRARFTKGLKAGDRVLVRLFTPQNQLIGFSEFELLSEASAVTLVLPERPLESRLVRTVYGLDTDQDSTIDSQSQVYDYFTQVTQASRWQQSQVSFFQTVQNFNWNSFNLTSLPAPSRDCLYPTSFTQGDYSLISQSWSVFESGLPPVFTSNPGQIVQVYSLSSTTVSTYQVSQLITEYRSVNMLESRGERDEDREGDDDRKPGKRRHCNQGIGNGSEGCDPGNSRPHGGSNDEGGRTPGGRWR